MVKDKGLLRCIYILPRPLNRQKSNCWRSFKARAFVFGIHTNHYQPNACWKLDYDRLINIQIMHIYLLWICILQLALFCLNFFSISCFAITFILPTVDNCFSQSIPALRLWNWQLNGSQMRCPWGWQVESVELWLNFISSSNFSAHLSLMPLLFEPIRAYS